MKGWATYSPGRWFWVHEREAALVVSFIIFPLSIFYYSILSFQSLQAGTVHHSV